jgi:hypothetical protein
MTDAKRYYINLFNEANIRGDVGLIEHSVNRALSVINAERVSQGYPAIFVEPRVDPVRRIWPYASRLLMFISFALAVLGLFGPIALALLSTDTASVNAGDTVSETFALRFAEDVIELPPTIGVSAIPSDNPLAARLAEYAVFLQDRAGGSNAAEDVRRPRSETTGAHP